jgi:hypothetical protein
MNQIPNCPLKCLPKCQQRCQHRESVILALVLLVRFYTDRLLPARYITIHSKILSFQGMDYFHESFRSKSKPLTYNFITRLHSFFHRDSHIGNVGQHPLRDKEHVEIHTWDGPNDPDNPSVLSVASTGLFPSKLTVTVSIGAKHINGC